MARDSEPFVLSSHSVGRGYKNFRAYDRTFARTDAIRFGSRVAARQRRYTVAGGGRVASSQRSRSRRRVGSGVSGGFDHVPQPIAPGKNSASGGSFGLRFLRLPRSSRRRAPCRPRRSSFLSDAIAGGPRPANESGIRETLQCPAPLLLLSW